MRTRAMPLLATVTFLAVAVTPASAAVSGTCKARRTRKGGAADRAWNSIERECRDKLEANRTAAAMRCLEGHFLEAREPGKRDGDWHTTLRKLRHDAEMFTWLTEEGKVKEEVKKLWRSIYHSARDNHVQKPDKVFEVNFQEQNDDRMLWQRGNNKAVYIDPSGKEVPKKTIRAKAAAFSGLESSFNESGRAVVDKLLSDKALRLIRRFLQASTFYFYPRPGHHLLALLEDGLASPLLAQLADGLRNAMPTLLGPLPLTGAFVWKADNSALASANPGGPELAERSADAAVSVLIWTVPSNVLNGSAVGALQLRQRRDDDAVIAESNSESDKDTSDVAPEAVIKYAANRAVIWDSKMEAVWKGPGWRGGFLNRGLHFLLNFGWAGVGSC
eukprot:TRINITY_DN16109_c0_g2_i1.p1 TRINITY_DN16109_c0_g2~~TRINITY_DN16109_c0_g2_i1.p1  ORF type:complete len:388 (+),score=83.29 TRINITY_DN16109_c0_g2_i1:140-1303(+)